MHPLLFQFGHIAVPTYGALLAVALVTLLALLEYFARRLTLPAGKLWNLGMTGILAGLIAERVLVAAEYFGAFRAHPFWVLGLTAIRSWWVDPAAVAIGLCAALLYALAEGLPLRRVLDCAALAATPALAIRQVGAFLAGADFGLPSASGWGATYTSRLAALWYHTPLGVRLVPVQLYEAAALAVIFAAMCWWIPRRAEDGELCGWWLLLAGMAGFLLGFGRAFATGGFVIHEAVCAGMVVASAALLVRWRVSAGSYTGVNDAQNV